MLEKGVRSRGLRQLGLMFSEERAGSGAGLVRGEKGRQGSGETEAGTDRKSVV